MRDDLPRCEHSAFCYVDYAGWHHVPLCPRFDETEARERAKAPSARAEPRKPKVSFADIAEAFERNKEGL